MTLDAGEYLYVVVLIMVAGAGVVRIRRLNTRPLPSSLCGALGLVIWPTRLGTGNPSFPVRL